MAVVDPDTKALKEFSIPQATNSTSCIVLPDTTDKLRPSTIHLLPSFHGMPNNDPYLHLKDFLEICSKLRLAGVWDESIHLSLFPFSLKDKAKQWLHSLTAGSITSWEGLNQKYLAKFFPIQKTQTIRR